MHLPLKLKTITSKTEFKLKEKGSLFLSQAIPINSEEEAQEIITQIRKKFYDATHNCYAYKLSNGKTKYSDDGEPNGTAGVRILNSINHFDLVDIIVIVTRYFGGVKLGVGPLGKAYADCSMECLKIVQIVTKFLYSELIISFDFELSNFVHRILSRYGAKIHETIYLDKPQIRCFIEANIVKKVIDDLIESSHNKVICKVTNDTKYFDLEN